MTSLFREALELVKSEGLYRTLRLVEGQQARAAVIDGRETVLFCSNDYLGLADHPEIKKSVAACVKKHGWGAGASRLISGTTRPHMEFEERVAAYLDKPSALLFNSGYAANVGTLTALLGRDDKVFADRLCHASLLDGARWSGAKLFRFAHNDTDSLRKLLEKEQGRGKRLIVTEGVFSMDGDRAPLAEIAGIAERYGAILMVDDAHGFGLFGDGGRGTVHEAGVADRVDIHVVTLGKAMGGAGGVVAGSHSLMDGLINFSRSFIYSTAIPPAAAQAGGTAIDIVSGAEGDALRKTLHENFETASEGLKDMGCDTGASLTQIIPVIIGDSRKVAEFGKLFLEQGLFAPAIRPPTVPAGTARFRLSVTSAHTKSDLAKLFEMFRIVQNT